MSFAAALGKDIAANKDLLRTRSFEFNGHKFKVKVPLTVELEAIHKRVSEPDEALTQKYYQQLTTELLKRKDEMQGDDVEFKEDDVVIQGKSIKELASQKGITENRIVEMFKLLVPEDTSFDMNTLTYDMVEELFPFSVQLEVMEYIASTITSDYSQNKKK